MSIDNFLRTSAEKNPDKIALYFGDQEITYAQIDQEVDRLAQGLLDIGLQHQQRVNVLLGNTPDFIRAYFAITRAGGTVVPINPLYKGEEIKYILNDAEVVFLITAQPFLPIIESIWNEVPTLKKAIIIGGKSKEKIVSYEEILSQPAKPVKVPVKESDIAACLYTSGTTGKPKGALLSHGNLMFDADAVVRHIAVSSADSFLCVLPLFHSYAQMVTMICPIFLGSSTTIMGQFRPDYVLREINQKKITIFAGVPAMFGAILQSSAQNKDFDLSSLRLCASGGAAMPLKILRAFEEKYSVIILEGNGPTETSPVSYFNPLDKRKPGSVGIPLQGVKVKIVDDHDQELPVNTIGEICVQGSNVMQGYLNQPEATAEAMKGGWFHTGDLGKIDEDGYVYIIDRKKDMIIVSGLNVYPREIEEYLYQHPSVLEAAVIAMHDNLRGEVPKAFIVLKPGTTETPKELMAYCRKGLATYKCPRQIIIVENLPRNATGKIDKKQLKEAESLDILNSVDS